MAKTNYSFFMSLCLLVVLSILQARSFADPQLTAPYVEYYHKMNIYDSLPKFKNKFTNQSYLTESNLLFNVKCNYSKLLSSSAIYCFPASVNLLSQNQTFAFSNQQIIDKQRDISPIYMQNNYFAQSNKSMNRNRQQSFLTAYEILSTFLNEYPDLKPQLESAAGYGVFETSSFNLVLYAGGWGNGMVFDNVEKNVIYVDTARVGTGIGLGYITEYTLIIFHNHFAITQYFGAKVGGDVGASATVGIWSKSFSFNPRISTYKIYKNGANIQGNWGATAYWISPLLN